MTPKFGKVSSHTCPYLVQGYRRCGCATTPLYEYRAQTVTIIAWDRTHLAAQGGPTTESTR